MDIDVFCNKCKKFIKTYSKDVVICSDEYRNLIHHVDYCDKCGVD